MLKKDISQYTIPREIGEEIAHVILRSINQKNFAGAYSCYGWDAECDASC